MDKTKLLAKLRAYKARPDIFKGFEPQELADLTIIVLNQVSAIEEAIKKGRLDGKTPEKDKDYMSRETAMQMLRESIKDYGKELSNVASQLDSQVSEAIQRIRDGKDAVVSDFLGLTDTPASYTGQTGKFAKVNAAEDGLEFVAIPGGGDMLSTNNLSDVANVATARTNLGLGTAAQSATTDFAPTLGADDNYVTDAEKAALHAAVTVTDSTEIDFTLTGQDITASLKASSIDETKLDASVNASLDLADSASQPGHTHTLANITDVTASVAEVNVLDGIPATLTATELGYVDGVTSAIQTQLNAKAPTASPTFTGTVTLPTGLTGVIRTDSGVVSVDTDVTDIVAAASTTVAGKVELAIASEVNTGTSTALAVSPDSLAGSYAGTKTASIQVNGSASGSTALATGDGQAVLAVDSTLNGMNITAVKAYVTTVSSSGSVTINIRRSRRSTATARTIVDTLSTAITVEVSEFESADATTAPVINTANDDLATGDLLLIDIDAAGTGVLGLTVLITCQLP